MNKLPILGVLLLLASPAGFAADAASPGLLSGVDTQYLDPSVRAQDDLFRHTNGKWLDTVAIPADQAYWGSFSILDEQTQMQLRGVAEDAVKASNPSPNLKRVADLYTSFMDEAGIEQRGIAPLADELARIDAITSRAAVVAEFAHLNQLDVSTPMSLSISQDHRDATKYVVTLDQGGLGLPDRDYFLDLKDKRFAEVRRAYLAYIHDILADAGDAKAAQLAPHVLAFETALAKISWDNVALRDPVKTYNKYPLGQLASLSPALEWSSFAEASDYNHRTDYLIIGEPSYFKALGTLLTKTSLADLKAYLKLCLVNRAAPYLNKQMVDTSFAFNGTVLAGVPELRPRWKRALRLINASIGDDMGQAYVAQYFPAERKERVEKLVGNLIAAFQQSIDTLDWMGDQTKTEAHTKLSKLMVKIGYPQHPKDYSTLTIKPDDLFGNVERASQFEYLRNMKKLGQPIDRSEWAMTAQTINAYYNPELNEIVFPAAILQPPFFNAAADDAVNYGGAGAVIGHEISHGFDDQGAQYDGDGNLRDWWTKADHAAFLQKTKALIAQYDAYSPLPGYHIKGALTLGENIADNSGLAIAYKAYRLSLAGHPSSVIDGMSGEQRLYYGFAQIWRSKERDAALVAQIKSDPHSPDPFRANGSARNQPGFYEAFDVKPGDALYLPPAARVIMW